MEPDIMSGSVGYLTTLSEDILFLIINALLYSCIDLHSLQQTCKRFGGKYITAPVEKGMWSIVDEMARLWINRCGQYQQAFHYWPRIKCNGMKSWLRVMFELQNSPHFCCRSSEQILFATTYEGAIVARVNKPGKQKLELNQRQVSIRTPVAKTEKTMANGKHFAQIVLQKNHVYFGVIPASCELTEGMNVFKEENYRLFHTETGRLSSPTYENPLNATLDTTRQQPWKGMRPASRGDRIGLLLDCDEGNLRVFLNGHDCGVMTQGLEGEFHWVIVLRYEARVRIIPVYVSHAMAEVKYRSILAKMRIHQKFVINYANKVLPEWQEENERQLQRVSVLQPKERDRCLKGVKISKVIRIHFNYLLTLLAENPQVQKVDYKIDYLLHLVDILVKVLNRYSVYNWTKHNFL